MESKFQKVSGVLHATPLKQGKKKDGTSYSIQQLVLEIDGYYEDKDGTPHDNLYFMLFDLSKKTKENLDLYSINDPIILSYTMKGRSYKKKDGTMGYDNALMAVGIEHADVGSNSRKATPAKEQPKAQKESVPVSDDDLPF